MARDDCDIATRNVDDEAAAMQRAFVDNVDSRLDDFMGTKKESQRWYNSGHKLDKKAAVAWDKLRVLLMDNTTEMAKRLNYAGYDLEDRFKQLQDYIQGYLKVPHLMHDIKNRKISHLRIIAMSKIIGGLIHLQETRLGKALAPRERAFLPVTAFAMRADPFGQLYKYAKAVTQLGEQSRNRTSKFRRRHTTIIDKYREQIDNIVGNHEDIFDSSWVMDGIEVFDTYNNPMIFYGSELRNGEVMHKVRRLDGESTGIEYIDSSSIETPTIRSGIVDLYSTKLLDDLMHGESRKVTWHDEATGDDLEQIGWYSAEFVLRSDEGMLAEGMQEIHTITSDEGTSFNYIMLHDNESQTWKAYVISDTDSAGKTTYYYDALGNRKHTKVDNKNVLRGHSVKDGRFKDAFKDGFYKAEEYKTFGDRFVRNEDPSKHRFMKGQKDRGWYFGRDTKKTYMTNQPKEEIIQSEYLIGQDEKYPNQTELLGTMYELRQLYEDIGKEMALAARIEQHRLEQWLSEDDDGKSKLSKTLELYMGEESATSTLAALKDTLDIGSRVFIDDSGNVSTPNSHFKMIGETGKRGGALYAPTIYEDSQLNAMIDNQITQMESDLANLRSAENPDEDVIKELQNTINKFELTRARRENMEERVADLEAMLDRQSVDGKANLAERAVHTKHRTSWTDPSMRDRSAEVFDKYMHNTFYSIEKNNLMVNMLDTMENVLRSGGFEKDAVGWLINRTKVSFIDPTAKATAFGIDISNQRFADFLNKIPFTGRTWNAQSAGRLILITKALISSALLGSNGALTNRTQITNDIISFGMEKWRKSADALGNPETHSKWMAIIDNAGTDEIISMFMDHMAQTTDLTWRDAGLLKVPGAPVQIPTIKMGRFIKMAMQNRKKFVDEGIPELNDKLSQWENYRFKAQKDKTKRVAELEVELEKALQTATPKHIKSVRKQLKTLQNEENSIHTIKDKRNIRDVREAFIELVLTPRAEGNADVIKARYLRLMGQVSDDRVKKFVAWKLSWWPETFGKSLFTFTGGEQLMRRQTAIMNLMTADEMGLLGSDTGTDRETDHTYIKEDGTKVTVKVESRFLTDEAVRIAREGVNNSMFGMSQVYLGEAFLGLGGHFGLYKAYPLQQMIHDMKQVKLFWAGGDQAQRIKDATAYLLAQGADGSRKYKITDPKLDHEAIAAVRFILTRGAMTAVSIAVGAIPFLRALLRSPFSGQFGHMVRGGENPGLALVGRLLMNGLIWASADDDNFERGDEMVWDIMRMFFPVFLTLPLLWVSQQFFED